MALQTGLFQSMASCQLSVRTYQASKDVAQTSTSQSGSRLVRGKTGWEERQGESCMLPCRYYTPGIGYVQYIRRTKSHTAPRPSRDETEKPETKRRPRFESWQSGRSMGMTLMRRMAVAWCGGRTVPPRQSHSHGTVSRRLGWRTYSTVHTRQRQLSNGIQLWLSVMAMWRVCLPVFHPRTSSFVPGRLLRVLSGMCPV
jgi:hypothetical protein